MGSYSAAGTVEGWNVMSPKWVDLAPGYRYTICLANGTDADITAASLALEGADEDPANMCRPGPFTPLNVEPDCGQPLQITDEPATITITPEAPIRARSQCQVSFPCPKRFVRVTGTAGGLDVVLVIRDLKRTGMQDVDMAQFPFGYQTPAQAGAAAAAHGAPAGQATARGPRGRAQARAAAE